MVKRKDTRTHLFISTSFFAVPWEMALSCFSVAVAAILAGPPPPIVPAAMPKLILGPENAFGLFGVRET